MTTKLDVTELIYAALEFCNCQAEMKPSVGGKDGVKLRCKASRRKANVNQSVEFNGCG